MVLISHEYKFIYLKTFKTCSSSTYQFFAQFIKPGINTQKESYFGEKGIVGCCKEVRNPEKYGQHITALDVKRKLGDEIFNSYFKFTIIRNPYDKLVSRFNHDGGFRKFKTFKDYYTNFQPHKHTTFEENWKVYTINDNPVVDDYIMFENLVSDYNKIIKKIGIKKNIIYKDIPKIRVNEKLNYRKFYNRENIEDVTKGMKKEIDFFNYLFF
tara:strand:+ start:8187 stop:8822 length:636 start_codon:yes stop_codon:yes gene_type:complete